MDADLLKFAGGIIIALLGVLGGWLVKARQLSGKIETTEAHDLWAESASIRQDYREQLAACNARCAALENRIAKVEDLNQLLGIDNRELRQQVSRLERELMEERAKR